MSESKTKSEGSTTISYFTTNSQLLFYTNKFSSWKIVVGLTGEVPLGLEWEEGESEAEESRDADGHQHPAGVVVDGDARHPERQGESEDEHRHLKKTIHLMAFTNKCSKF